MSIGTPQEKRIFDTMSLKDALSYCYAHRKEFVAEQSQESFDCLIVILEDGTILPANLPEYGMDFEEDAILHDNGVATMENKNGIPPMTEAEQMEVRRYIAIAHEEGKCHIYGDDGELHCGNVFRHGRTIDFRREKMSDIINILQLTHAKESGAISCLENPAQLEKSFAMWDDSSKRKQDCEVLSCDDILKHNAKIVEQMKCLQEQRRALKSRVIAPCAYCETDSDFICRDCADYMYFYFKKRQGE
jgi:hypothetical protein